MEETYEDDEGLFGFDANELALHEIDETMLKARKKGAKNPHIDYIKEDEVQKYQFENFVQDLKQQKLHTPEENAKHTSTDEDINKTKDSIDKSQTVNKVVNEQSNIDINKIDKKIQLLSEGLRIGLKNIENLVLDKNNTSDNFEPMIQEFKESQKSLEDNLTKTISEEINNISSKEEEELDDKFKENLISSLNQLFSKQLESNIRMEDFFEKTRKNMLDILSKILENEINDNSKEIIENTLLSLKKDFNNISEINIILSTSDKNIEEEINRFLKNHFKDVKNIKIKFEETLSKGSFLFNTNVGNAQSILEDKFNLLKNFL